MSSDPLQVLLDIPFISRIRRNHGLEHATLHVLSQRYPRRSIAGHSTSAGFRLIGDFPTNIVEQAVGEALNRLQAGEQNLAVHPNCGTNFVTAGVFSGLAGAATMFGVGQRARDKIERLPLAAALATLALIAALPLGLLLQRRVTTSGIPDGLKVVSVASVRRGGVMIHSIRTEG